MAYFIWKERSPKNSTAKYTRSTAQIHKAVLGDVEFDDNVDDSYVQTYIETERDMTTYRDTYFGLAWW